MGVKLPDKTAHIVCELCYLVIEAVYLCGIADDGAEGVQIIVELTLQVGGGFHLFLRPDVACGL